MNKIQEFFELIDHNLGLKTKSEYINWRQRNSKENAWDRFLYEHGLKLDDLPESMEDVELPYDFDLFFNIKTMKELNKELTRLQRIKDLCRKYGTKCVPYDPQKDEVLK